MRRYASIILASTAITGLLLLPALAAADHGYVGVGSCKMCHKSAKSGNQYGKWLESKHAKAYEVLGTDAAKAAAKKLGLEGDPQALDECLACHVTAHGVKAELLGKKYRIEDGVGCESCHGPGSDYKKKKVMQDQAASVAAGMVVPTKETCQRCHNEKSPTFKSFDFDEYSAKIAHPVPEKAGK